MSLDTDTLQMEFVCCQASSRFSHPKSACAMGKLLALLLVWVLSRLAVRLAAKYDGEVTCSAIGVTAQSPGSRNKGCFQEYVTCTPPNRVSAYSDWPCASRSQRRRWLQSPNRVSAYSDTPFSTRSTLSVAVAIPQSGVGLFRPATIARSSSMAPALQSPNRVSAYSDLFFMPLSIGSIAVAIPQSGVGLFRRRLGGAMKRLMNGCNPPIGCRPIPTINSSITCNR